MTWDLLSLYVGDVWFWRKMEEMHRGKTTCFHLCLFILVTKILGKILFRAVDGGYLYGFQVEHGAKGVITITHFLFAIDAVLFCDATSKNLG